MLPITAPACAPVGVLLVHGLGGTEFDLGAVYKALRQTGVDTHTLTLPGHGLQPEDLLGITAEDWVEAVSATYRELLPRYRTLHLVGMCLGALLVIEVAKREHHHNGNLVALAPPVFINGWSMPWYRALRHLVYRLPGGLANRMRVVEAEPFGVKNARIRRMVCQQFAQNHPFHYGWIPLSCIRQVDRLRGWVKRSLADIRSPTLIIHSREDELTSLRSAELLVRRIGAQTARMDVLENSYHMICVDNDRHLVARKVLAHLGLGLAAQPVAEQACA